MRYSLLALIGFSLALTAAACRYQQAEALPREVPAGNALAGKEAFLELRCWSCHEIEGTDMPKPVAAPIMPVFLGGNARPAPDDLYLLQAIVNPSHELAPGWGTDTNIRSENLSRMGDYSEVMSARQLFDLIAFLKSRYAPPER